MAQLHRVLQSFVEVIEAYHRERCPVLTVPESLTAGEAAVKAVVADLGVEPGAEEKAIGGAGAGAGDCDGAESVAGSVDVSLLVAEPAAISLTSAQSLRQRLSRLIEEVNDHNTSRTSLLNYCLDAAVQIQEILDGERGPEDINKSISFLTQFMLNMQTFLKTNQAKHTLPVYPDASVMVELKGGYSFGVFGAGMFWTTAAKLINDKLFPAFELSYESPSELFAPIIKGTVNEFCLEKAVKDLAVAGQDIARLEQLVANLQVERADFKVKLAASAAALEHRVKEVTMSAAPGMAAPKQGFFSGGGRSVGRAPSATNVGLPAPVTSASASTAAVDTTTHRGGGGKGWQRGGKRSDASPLPASPVAGPR